MLAQERFELVRPSYNLRRRKRESPITAVTKSPQTCVLLVAAVALLMTVPYVGAYAKTYSKGCGKNAILMHLNQVKTENQVLRLKLDSLKRPERIEKFASSHGMERSKTMAYVETAGQANVAENTGAAD